MRWLSGMVMAAAALLGCFSSSSFTPHLEESAITTGMTTASVRGRNFAPGIEIYWNGKPQPTRFLNDTTAQFDLDVDQTRVATTAELTAKNDGGYLSPPLRVSVVDASLSVTALSAAQFVLGSPETLLTVNGTGFTPHSQVLWNEIPLVTTFSSSTIVSASVPASLLAIAGDNFIRVQRCLTSICEPSNVTTCTVGAAVLNVVGRGAFDLAWDSTHATIFAATKDSSGIEIVAPLDPLSLGIGFGVAVPAVQELSISDQDQYIYIASWNNGVLRFQLPGLTNVTTFPSATSFASSVAALPGSPSSVAFVGPGVNIADGTVVRQKRDGWSIQSISWGFDSSTLFGIGSFGFYAFGIDQTGVASATLLSQTAFYNRRRVYYERTTRRLYGDAGENFDEQGADPRPFAVPRFGSTTYCAAAVDGHLGKAFFACLEPPGINSGTILTIRSFDIASQRPIAMVLLHPYRPSDFPHRMLRWGNDGLAVGTAYAIYLYSGQFVR